jgi:hypothetical protein
VIESSPAKVADLRLMSVPREISQELVEQSGPRTIEMRKPERVATQGLGKEGLVASVNTLRSAERNPPVAKLLSPRVRVPLPALQRLGLARKG